MAAAPLSPGYQCLIIVLVLATLAGLLFGAYWYRKRTNRWRSRDRVWKDIERDFVIIGGPEHMAAIKKSESANSYSMDMDMAPRLSTQALLYGNPVRSSPYSNHPIESPAPPYGHQ